LLNLVNRVGVEMGAARPLGSSPAGEGATAEFSTVLSWRGNFGSNRRAEVRIAASYVRDGGQWRFAQWRILGSPDLR
jgi:hypothetical protein